MPNKRPTVDRVRALTAQALKEANIEEHTGLPLRPGASRVYWQPVKNGIELIIEYDADRFGVLHCKLSITPLSHFIAEFFPEDADAVSALVAVFEYLHGTLSDLLPTVGEGVQARRVNLSFPTTPQREKQVLKLVRSIIGPSLSSRDLTSQERNKQLRGEPTGEWRGGSHRSLQISDENLAIMSKNYPPLLRHWQTIKKLRKTKVPNWRRYAKSDEPDTPDDLLDRLDGKLPPEAESDGEAYLNIPSALAIEHAARRAGIPANFYGLSQLGRLRRLGDKIRSQSKT